MALTHESLTRSAAFPKAHFKNMKITRIKLTTGVSICLAFVVDYQIGLKGKSYFDILQYFSYLQYFLFLGPSITVFARLAESVSGLRALLTSSIPLAPWEAVEPMRYIEM